MSATTMAVAVAVETVGRNTPLAFAVVMVRPTPQYAACLYYRREVNAFQPDLRLFPVQTCPWIRRFMGWPGIVASPAREHHGRHAHWPHGLSDGRAFFRFSRFGSACRSGRSIPRTAGIP